jgi:hypothetical protein
VVGYFFFVFVGALFVYQGASDLASLRLVPPLAGSVVRGLAPPLAGFFPSAREGGACLGGLLVSGFSIMGFVVLYI